MVKSYLNENIRPINKQQNESEHPLESKQTDKNFNKIKKINWTKRLTDLLTECPILGKTQK